MRRLTHAAGLFLATAALSTMACDRPSQPGDPVRGLDAEQGARFTQGKAVFDREFDPESGLGPLFNAVSCGECHEEPVSGGVGDEVELHASATLDSGTCDLLGEEGGPVVQSHATPALEQALGIKEEPLPAHATSSGKRTTPDIFGMGLLDAVPEKSIVAMSDPDDRDHDGISGRVNRGADGRVGRFGRKAFVAALREFNAGAFLIEQGITSPPLPAEEQIGGAPPPPGTDPAPDPEIDQESLDRADFFVRTLAPLDPLPLKDGAKRGRRLFASLGCVACHVPVLKTGDSPIKALDHRSIAAYTDLLLHDMGEDLADICLGLATTSEFRTEPLTGLRFSQGFLHDGRAPSIEEAIRLHDGEARAARDRFAALPEKKRQELLAFLGCL